MALTLTRENSWRPLRKKDEHEYLYQVEKAKSGRARCRRCSEFIAKDDLRFALPIRDPRGEFGYISAWQHVACTRIDASVSTENLDEKIHGLSSLSRTESQKVLDEVTSSEKPEHLQELNPDDLVKRGAIEPMRAPAAVLQHLLPFQEEGLRWMVEQESIDVEAAAAAEEEEAAKKRAEEEKANPPKMKVHQLQRIPTRPSRGGILADEMGMGKTIQMISLIVANRGPGPTLVVAPVSSMMQWQEEINTNVATGELDVVVFHKTAQFTKEQLEVADVVLTTYPVLERAWRMLVNDGKVKCAYCNQLFLPRKLVFHNKYYCGPDAKRTEKLLKREKGDGDDTKAAKNRNKVQKKSTIKKGLKTLQVDVADSDIDSDDDEEDVKSKKKGTTVAAKNSAAAAKKSKGKKQPAPKMAAAKVPKKAAPKKATGKRKAAAAPSFDDDDEDGSEWEEWVDSDAADSDVEVVVDTKQKSKKAAPKKAAAKKAAPKKAAAKKAAPKKVAAKKASKAAPKKSASKKKQAESSSDDDSCDSDVEAAATAATSEKKGVVGPMGMYRELMAEAGRKARGRWEKAKLTGTSSDDDDGTSSSSSSSNFGSSDDDDDDSSVADSSDDDDDGSADSDDSKAAKKKKSKATNPIICKDCGFQLAAYEYCPETGDEHPEPNLRPLPKDDEDHGADVVDLSQSVLHSVQWFRVILDEAHRIKGRTTSTARSAYALNADRKWCVTGTPLQNRVGDLYSLLRFMRLTPYARYYCSAPGCKCTTLSHPFSRDLLNWCVHCGHGPLQHYSYFNRHIMNPIVRYGYVGDGRKSMMLLSGDVLNRIMLRRTKTERAEDIKLPPCEISVVSVELSDAERDFYTSLYKKSTARFDTFVEKGTLLHNYAHIFQLLSRLRQALDHPYLVLFSDSAYAAAAAATAIAAAPVKKQEASAKLVKREEEETETPSKNPSKKSSSAAGAKRGRAGSKVAVKKEEGLDDEAAKPATGADDADDVLNQAAATLGITLDALPAAATNPSDVCHLCQESTCARTRFVVEPCKHGFHRLCLLEYIETLPEQHGDGAAAAAAVAAESGGSAKKPRGKKAAAAAIAPNAPRCPRCFVPVALDLRRLSHVMDDVPDDEEADANDGGDEGLGDESPQGKKGRDKKPAAKKAPPKKAARREGNNGAAAADAAPPAVLMPARPDDDDDDDDANLFTVMNPAKPGDDDDDDEGDSGKPAVDEAKPTAAKKSNEFRAGSIMNRIDTAKFVMGTKLSKVVEHVQTTVPADEKVIVFSQFGAMLDLVEFALESHGVRTVKLMGHMPLSQRQAMLRAFRNEPSVKCILISLKAGGEGLNLQCANHVVLIDPWWNPAVEMQAVQRAHRIGQRKVVKAVRFVTKDSVEERMMSLQDKKLLVFQGTVDGSTESLQRLSEEDLQFLFTR